MAETGTTPEEYFQKLSSSPKGLSNDEAAKRLKIYGFNAIQEKKHNLFLKALSYFWGPIPWMIEAAALLSLFIRHWADFILIMVLLVFNALVAFWQEYQASSAIEELKKKLAVRCRVLRDGEWQEMPAESLVPGDVVRVRLGDIIPADVFLFDCEYVTVDQSALTGESLPVSKKQGEGLFSGSVATKGEGAALVTATGAQTYFGKTAKLVESAQPESHFQQAILTIGNFLIFLCVALVCVLLTAQLVRGGSILHFLKFALILIIASIPVAMPAVLSVTMAVGALALSRMKAIVTRLESIEEMAGVDTICSDKTGTLTYNKLTVGEVVALEPFGQEEVLFNAALASRAEDFDLIDKTVLEAVKKPECLKAYQQEAFLPFDPIGKRTEATVRETGKEQFQVSKGAPQVIVDLCRLPQDKQDLIENKVNEYAKKGYRTLGVARKEKKGAWQFAGLIPLYDQIRDDSKETIRQAREHGIGVKMITGDNLAIAKEVSNELGIGGKIYDSTSLSLKTQSEEELRSIGKTVEQAEGFAQVFPESKFWVVKALQSLGHIVGMTGDGVNDAPALKQANLGIAVSGATDAARSAASLVLTAPGLSVIIQAVEGARRIFERMNTYAIYRITETIRIMFFMVFAMLIYNFYPINALMLILLALLNDIPIMTIAYDHTLLPQRPVHWQMPRVISTACVLGGVGVIETLLLMYFAESWLQVGLEQLQSIIFLKLLLAGHLTLFVARTRNALWIRPFPAPVLVAAIFTTQIAASLIVGFGMLVPAVHWAYILGIWGYCLVWMLIEDRAKMLVYYWLDKKQKEEESA